jgi:hypothetical protein
MRRQCRGIEHDGNDLEEMVFFDDDARHAQPQTRLRGKLGKMKGAKP